MFNLEIVGQPWATDIQLITTASKAERTCGVGDSFAVCQFNANTQSSPFYHLEVGGWSYKHMKFELPDNVTSTAPGHTRGVRRPHLHPGVLLSTLTLGLLRRLSLSLGFPIIASCCG